jgi:uncharacterized protein (TIGR02145 family)
MVQNLRLGSDSEGTQLTPEDTNISENWTLPQIDNVTTFENNMNPMVADPASDAAKAVSPYCFNGKGTFEDCGLHYNWSAAIASNDSSVITSGVAPNSICPKNWHLPTGEANGEFALLDKAMDGSGAVAETPGDVARWTNSYQFAAVFLALRYRTGWGSSGTRGYYWSSTAWGPGSAYNLTVRTDFFQVYPGTSTLSRMSGTAVRCVL